VTQVSLMRSLLSIAYVGGALLASVCPAAAQAQRPERPYRGLFGGGVSDAEQSLTANLSFGAGWDKNVFAEFAGGQVDPLLTRTGGYGLLSGGLNYSMDRRRVDIGAGVSSSARYYPNLSTQWVASHSGAFGIGIELNRKTSLSGQQTVSYQPYNYFHLFPELYAPALGTAAAPNHDFGAGATDYLTYNTRVGLSRELSRRATLQFSYDRYKSDFSTAGISDFSSQGGGGTLQLQMTKDLGVRLGYQYRQGDYPLANNGSRQVRNHNIDAGIDYNRVLSLTRRTTVGFSTGSAAVSDGENTRFNVIGRATLNREFGRTWRGFVGYNRDLQFIETFQSPLFSDSLSGGIDGLISQRLSFEASTGTSLGSVGFSADDNGYDSVFGSAGLSYALNRFVSLGVNYTFYHYSFENAALLPAGVPKGLERNGVSASINLWAPVFTRSRRSNAAR
jgi:hypothetical protein